MSAAFIEGLPKTVTDYAKEYRMRGWAPLPLGGVSGKVPQAGEGWQNFGADDDTIFADNLGIILGARSRGLHDIDLDCQEAVRMASVLLPPTNSRFGRPGKPNSHYLYICPFPLTTVQFQTSADGMLVELRGNGGQTMFPPSWNRAANEQVEWACDGEPTRIDSGELLRDAGNLAGMSLLVRHWPAETGRFNAEGAFIGTLLRAGRGEADVVKLLKLIQQHAGAARDHAPEKAVRRLAKKLAEGKPVPGLRKLREYLGEEVADKAAEWMGLSHGLVYEERADGIYWHTVDRDDRPVEVRLGNFNAHITQVVNRDDGSGVIDRRFVLEGNRGARIHVPAKDFDSMGWVTANWGPRASVEPGYGKKERLAKAIKELSEDEECVVYTHLGWRKIDGQWLYLHAGGAIGAEGPCEGYVVDPGGNLAHYVLPPVRRLREAVLASLGMLDMGAAGIVVACSAWRAPTAEFFPITVSVSLVGKTGIFKSALWAIAQAHWGSHWDGVQFPNNWSSTANELERGAYIAKDALYVIDDFSPHGSRYDIDSMHAKAERLQRAQGNLSGRGRLNSDSTLRGSYAPRGLIGTSGEDLPRGHSLRARIVAVRMAKGDVDKEKLTQLQIAATDGLLAEAMAAYVQWLAGRADGLPGWLAERRQKVREVQQADHARTPDNLANLIIGLESFLLFAVEIGVIDEEEMRDMRRHATGVLRGLAESQEEEQQAENPVEMFCAGVRELLAAGRVHLRAKSGGRPEDPVRYGWRYKSSTIMEVQNDKVVQTTRDDWVPEGRHIGWTDGSTLWLLPVVALAEVNTLLVAGTGRNIGKSEQTLWRDFKDAGVLVEWDEKRGRMTKPKQFEGEQLRVLCLAIERLLSEP
jgi:hypothetical protein